MVSSVVVYANTIKKQSNQNEEILNNPKSFKFSIERGMGIKDTSEGGTCITYGTYIRGDNNESLFIEADASTLASMGLPMCYGEGNYLV